MWSPQGRTYKQNKRELCGGEKFNLRDSSDERFDFIHVATGPLWGSRDRTASQEGSLEGILGVSRFMGIRYLAASRTNRALHVRDTGTPQAIKISPLVCGRH